MAFFHMNLFPNTAPSTCHFGETFLDCLLEEILDIKKKVYSLLHPTQTNFPLFHPTQTNLDLRLPMLLLNWKTSNTQSASEISWFAEFCRFLASPDALEVMWVSDWVSHSALALTWLMWPWWVMIPIEDLTDITLAFEQLMKVIKRRKKSSDESYQVMKSIKWWRVYDESY